MTKLPRPGHRSYQELGYHQLPLGMTVEPDILTTRAETTFMHGFGTKASTNHRYPSFILSGA